MGRFEISPKRRVSVVIWSFFVGFCLFPGSVKVSWGALSILKELKEQLVETKKEVTGLEKTLSDVRIQIVKRNVPSVRNQHLKDPICDSACRSASTMCDLTVLRALGLPLPADDLDEAMDAVMDEADDSEIGRDRSLGPEIDQIPLDRLDHEGHTIHRKHSALRKHVASGEGQCIAIFKKAGSDIYALGRISPECAEQVKACPWVKDQVELTEMQARVVSLESEIKDKKEELKTLRKDMVEASEGCTDCGAGSAGGSMSQREPTTAELILWGLGNIGVPLAQTGLGFAANIEAMKYSNNAYGQYVDQCRKAGVPCAPPGAFFGGSGAAYSGGVQFAGSGGLVGPSFNGGGAVLPLGAFGGGAYPIAGGVGGLPGGGAAYFPGAGGGYAGVYPGVYPGGYAGGYPGNGGFFGNASLNLPSIGFPGANMYGGGYAGGYPGGYPGNGGFFGNASLNLPAIDFSGANIYAGGGLLGGYPGGYSGGYPGGYLGGGGGYTGGAASVGGGVPQFNANGSLSLPGYNLNGGVGVGGGGNGGFYANSGAGGSGASYNSGWNIPTNGGLYVTGAGGANLSPPYLAPGYGNPQYQAMYGASAQNSTNAAYSAQRAQDFALAQRQFYEAHQNLLRVQQTSVGYGNFQTGASLRLPSVNAGFQFGPWGVAGALY